VIAGNVWKWPGAAISDVCPEHPLSSETLWAQQADRRLANAVLCWRLMSLAAFQACFSSTIVSPFAYIASAARSLACVVLALWTLSLFVLTQLFIRPPPTLHGKKGFIRRLGARMAIALRWVVSAGVTILGVMVLVVTARALLLVFKAVSG
jgi:hypothetical protein